MEQICLPRQCWHPESRFGPAGSPYTWSLPGSWLPKPTLTLEEPAPCTAPPWPPVSLVDLAKGCSNLGMDQRIDLRYAAKDAMGV